MPLIFFRYNESWYALGIYRLDSMRFWLGKSLIINLIGYSISLITLMYIEFFKIKVYHFEKYINIARININDSLLNYIFWFIVVIWYYIVFRYNSGLPMFNNSRAFFYNKSFSYIYQALNEIFVLYLLYYGIIVATKKKKYVCFIIALLTVFFQGSRSKILVQTLLPIIIWRMYVSKRNYENKISVRKKIKQVNKKILIIMPICAIVGICLGVFRADKSINLQTIISNFFFGNTFSDIRDGAFILKGFEAQNIGYLYGKTYLAGVLSFLPSSISKFKHTWSWGRFTTMYLFGLTDHFGLRGGNAMEAYINFGYFGVLAFSIGWGYILGMLENYFSRKLYLSNERINAKDYFVLYPILNLASTMAVSTGLASFYVDVLFVCGILFLSYVFRRFSYKTYVHRS